MKKIGFIILCLLAVLFVTVLCGGAPVSTRVLHRGTPVFSEARYGSEILHNLPQNEEVTMIGDVVTADNVQWQKIKFGDIEGWVDSANLYEFKGEWNVTAKIVKAKSKTTGEKINLYSVNVISDPAFSVKDGTKLQRMDNGVDYGDFYLVYFNDAQYFVEKSYATTGLSTNELIAVIVVSCTVALGIAAFFIVLAIKKAPLKNQPEEND